MSQRTEPRLPKLPFVFADIVLLGVAYLIFWRSQAPMTPWDMFFCAACVALGAVLCVAPFLLEYRAAVKLTEADRLANAVLQIENIEIIGRQINHATANWQAAHEQANKTVEAAREIAESIAAEARTFSEFLKKANETEKNHLRLEVDKLRRAESEWLQILVRILDHIFALNQAAVHSGQANLVKQLGQFQNACRDIARRVGLVPFVAIPGEPYDPKVHQLADAKVVPAAAARVAETIAAGYSFQGQLVRPALVTLQTGPAADQPEATAKPPGAEALASEQQPHGAEPETEFAATPVEGIPQLAPQTVETSPQIVAKEPLDSGQEQLHR
jgi:molecular chaperone GrpE (heat shock protein)